MPYEDYVKEIEINEIEELFNFIKGNNENKVDLRENFIFRGVCNTEHELIPSSLRENKINDYINPNFWFSTVNPIQNIDINFKKPSFNLEANNYMGTINNPKEGQVCKEKQVLFDFYKIVDYNGLNIVNDNEFRLNLNKNIYIKDKKSNSYPSPEFFKLMSLAQHYGIPTRALDWSYDYKIALYFAVSDIFDKENEETDCILWALNYKLFTKSNYINELEYPFELHFYRPEYNNNPNLNAQKGLFSILEESITNYSEKPLDQFICDILDKNISNKEYKENEDYKIFDFNGFNKIVLKNNEKVFYKFIISYDDKKDFLKELYKENYTEVKIFPGYKHIHKYIENKIRI